MTRPTVATAVRQLSQMGMVRELTGKERHRLFVYDGYVKLLSEGRSLCEDGVTTTMKPGSVKIFDRVSAVEAIRQLGEDDLRFLNRLIVERLKLLTQAKSTTLMARFGIGDRVCFQAPDGRELHGVVTRLNKKTVSVDTDDGHRWNVAPGFLRLAKAAGEDVRF